MKNLNEKEFKREYNYCKLKIKKWEGQFRAKYNRTPNKTDIKEANSDVKKYYKRYWYLKSSLLEEQILPDVNDDDDILSQTNLDVTNVCDDSINETKKVDLCDETSDKAKSQPTNPTLPNDKNNKPIGPKPIKNVLSEKLNGVTEKLFEGSSFKKRNPRKSFTNKNKSNLSAVSLDNSTLQKSPPKTHEKLNQDLSFSVEKDVSPNIKDLICITTSLSPLMSKFDQINKQSTSNSVPINLIEGAFVQKNVKSVTAPKVDLGWIERCANQNFDGKQISRDSGFESFTCGNENELDERKDDVINSSDDELIYGSDEEDNNQIGLSHALKRKIIESTLNPSKKIKLDETSAISVLQCDSKETSTIDKPQSYGKEISPINVFQSEAKEKGAIKDAPKSAKQEILEKKIKAGTLNENYVKINLKKKVFVRGKKKFNYSKYKKNQWKKDKKELNDERQVGGLLKCFLCGDIGHFAKDCLAKKEDELLPLDNVDDEDLSGLPSLAEAEEMAREMAATRRVTKPHTSLKLPQPEELPKDLPELEGVPQADRTLSVQPLHVTRHEIEEILVKFGHSSFREGQADAVMRILRGKSTLLMLSTGGGKSLCYQLPAYMYHRATKSIALVVSPLVSLMEDQVSSSSSFLKMGCLHNNQTDKQRAAVLSQIQAGELCALLVSPEAVVSCDNYGFGSFIKHLPPISFACIDEVHCVSQWSHNFRPSYLMLTQVLRERFAVKTFLGLTATARKTTVAGIMKELGISADDQGVIMDVPLPEHITLEVVEVADQRDTALLKYLKEVEGSILVYCTRREECERLASLIRTALNGVTADAYHAGLVGSRRKSVQKNFMQGKLRVVVATVAFGMGINKLDIRGVVHYNMPKDWESYVQEVGRAGRDGKPARCRLFLDPAGGDVLELRRHIHANSADRHVLRKLLARVFHACECVTGQCEGHEVAFPIAETVQVLDLPEENISTLLCYLELHPDRLIKVLPPAYSTCKVQSYQGRRGIEQVARKCPPLAVAAAQASRNSDMSSLTFDVIQLASKISWDSGAVKRHLKQTEWLKNNEGHWRRSGVHVSFTNLAFRVKAKGDLTITQLDDALNYLVQRVENYEKTSLALLESVHSTFKFFANKELENAKDENLTTTIRSYFKHETLPNYIPMIKTKDEEFNEELIAADVRQLICTFRDNTFNGRAIARIFQGIQSPNYPASLWYKTRFWRVHIDKPFSKLQQIATQEILRFR